MLARKCDVCGKFYIHYDKIDEYHEANAVMMISRYLDNKCYTGQKYDLCRECMGEFLDFIGKVKK